MHTEHFRPKKQVDIEDDPSQRGYWWLGAAWKNLLPACGHCNRSPGVDHPTGLSYGSGKGNRFPLLPGSPRANGPGQENAELPVLIDPSYEEPSHYFTFRVLDDLSFATIKHLKTTAEQFRATGTMEILGINRDGLVRMRTAHLKSVKYAVRGYIKAAKVLNQAIAGNAPQPVIDQCQTDVQQEWDELYDTYLNPSRQYLHATVRLVESELCSAGLKLSSLLQGRDLHLPAASLV
ncbi:hypothetical protein A9762_07370 [Pandoraea sp. ISTKB]|nr:hypothetical protein A9762_07370 [Pandoraea sp. ISTKB]